jgi:hypothetical protein
MLYAHFFSKGKPFNKLSIGEAPRKGELVRFNKKNYVITAITWCYDEEHPIGQRIDIAIEPE